MNKQLWIAAALSFATGGACWAQAAPPASVQEGDTVLRAGHFSLSKSEYEALVPGFDRTSGAPATGASPQTKRSGQDVARVLRLADEAQRRQLDKRPDIAALIRVRGYVMLTNALFEALVAEARKDEAGTRELWQAEQAQYQEVTVRQILVRFQGAKTEAGDKPAARTEAQAKAIAQGLHAKLAAGADFQALAKARSEDQKTARAGGLLPAFTRGAMTSEFEQVAYTVPVGQFSEPFKTSYGYHLVQVVDRRPFPFERVRSTLEFQRARKKLEEIANTEVQLSDTYFKP